MVTVLHPPASNAIKANRMNTFIVFMRRLHRKVIRLASKHLPKASSSSGHPVNQVQNYYRERGPDISLDSPSPYRGPQFLIAVYKLEPSISDSLQPLRIDKRKDHPFPLLRIIPGGRLNTFVLEPGCSQRQNHRAGEEYANQG